MNYLSQRIAYLKNLFHSMKMSELTNEGKVIRTIIDVMDDMVIAIEDLELIQEEQNEQLELLEKELKIAESQIFKKISSKSCEDKAKEEEVLELDDLEKSSQFEEWYSGGGEYEIYMVECCHCREIIELEKEIIIKRQVKSIQCPKCYKCIDIEWLCDCGD